VELKLKTCDIHACEAMCCHDGVYLEADDEAALQAIVEREPELRARLPEVYVVEGHWNGEHLGRKTATRPHDYLNPGYPAHFPRTRCVFADAVGFCELEKLARGRGEHPWTYKPFTCWMFPLEDDDGKAVPPPVLARDDPYRTKGYPGYVSLVPCGRHDANGKPWSAALEQELKFFRRAKRHD
jgi:hypothetical protein